MKTRALLIGIGMIVLVGGGSTALSQAPAPTPPPPTPLIDSATLNTEFLGEFNGREYTNRFFEIKLTVPDELTILSREQLDAFYAAGGEMIKSKDESGTDAFEEALVRTIPLIAVAHVRKEPNSNSAFEIAVTKQPEGATAEMALTETVRVLRGTGNYELNRYFANVRFGALTVTGAELSTSAFGPRLTQRTYVTMRKGFALFFSVTHILPEDRDIFDPVLNSISVYRP